MENPARYMMKNAETMLTGMASTGIRVARQSRRNAKMMNATRHEGDEQRLLHLGHRLAHVGREVVADLRRGTRAAARFLISSSRR